MADTKKITNLMASILLGVVISFIFVYLMGADPLGAFLTFITASFKSSVAIATLLSKAAPYIVMALGITIAFRASLFNVGGPGQMTLGATVGVLIGANLHFPSLLLIPMVLAGAAGAGALWGIIPTIFKAKFNADLVVSTLMMNYVATYFVGYLIREPMRDLASTVAKSKPLLPEAILPSVSQELQINAGILIVIFLAIIAYLLMEKSAFGYSVRALGMNVRAAKASGMNTSKIQVMTMMISGAFLGIGGAIWLAGSLYAVTAGFPSYMGFTAILVALLARTSTKGCIVAAFGFSILDMGAKAMNFSFGVPVPIIDIMIGVIVLTALASGYLTD